MGATATFRVGGSFRICPTDLPSNHPNPLLTIGRLEAADPLYTFSIRVLPPNTSAKIILCFQRLAEVGGSNFGLPPPFTSANYLRRIFPLFSTLGGSRRK